MSGEDAFIRFSETLTSHMRFRAVEQSVDLEEKTFSLRLTLEIHCCIYYVMNMLRVSWENLKGGTEFGR